MGRLRLLTKRAEEREKLDKKVTAMTAVFRALDPVHNLIEWVSARDEPPNYGIRQFDMRTENYLDLWFRCVVYHNVAGGRRWWTRGEREEYLRRKYGV